MFTLIAPNIMGFTFSSNFRTQAGCDIFISDVGGWLFLKFYFTRKNFETIYFSAGADGKNFFPEKNLPD